MGQFFKFVFATIVGLLLFIILFVIIVVILVPGEPKTPEKSVLRIDFDKKIEEREDNSLLNKIGLISGKDGTIGLLEIRKALTKAKTDDKIKGVLLNFGHVPVGYSMVEELRNSLLDFKSSGKFIVAYAESYTEGNYYLASVADKIYLPESGMVEWNGLAAQLLFFKGTLDKLEIRPEVFPVGKFKSAAEPFRFDKMSEANRIQIKSFLNSIYNHMIENVSQSRGIDKMELRKLSDSMLVRTSADALKHKLVTDIAYFDQTLDFIRTRLSIGKEEKISFVKTDNYFSAMEDARASFSEKKVAVIFATGDIVDGKGSRESIGSERMAAEIRKARMDDNVKAIVLRINSPGGSALASDVIWREVTLSAKKKPVIASMSDVAASGGYYIAMGCHKIVAEPTTITGSIGVFGLLFNGKDFLKKFGVTSDREKTGEFADIGSFTRDMTDYEKKEIQKEVERIYDVFKTKAALGRKTDTSTIEKYAQGRVWSGLEAKANGLIDELGGLEKAVTLAAKSAKLGEDYSVEYLPGRGEMLFDDFWEESEESAKAEMIKDIEPYYSYLKTLASIEKMKGIQARLPYEIVLK